MLEPCKSSQQELATERDFHIKTKVESVVFSSCFFFPFFLTKTSGTLHGGTKAAGVSEGQTRRTIP